MDVYSIAIIPVAILCIFFVLYYSVVFIPNVYMYDRTTIQDAILKMLFVVIISYYTLINVTFGFIAFVMCIVFIQSTKIIPELQFVKRREVFSKYVESKIKYLNKHETPALQTIPKIIIQIWITNEDDPKPVSNSHIQYMEKVRNLNPDYQYLFFTNRDVEPFFRSNYPEYYDTYKSLPMFIQKVDFLRYLAIHHYGGFYFDVDIDILTPLDDDILNHQAVFPIDEYIDKIECGRDVRFAPICNKGLDFLLGQYAFACVPKHPFVKLLIDTIHQNIDVYVDAYRSSRGDLETYVYRTTGPDFVTNVYADYREKSQIYILSNGKRQMFGNYAKHDYYGSWK